MKRSKHQKNVVFTFIGTAFIIVEILVLIGIRTIRSTAAPYSVERRALTIAEAPPIETVRAVEEPLVVIETVETATAPTEAEAEDTGSPRPAEAYLGEFKLTAYCGCRKCCGKNAKLGEDGEWLAITRSGVRAQEDHTISVDPDVIPLGSKVRIGEIIYTAEDTGGKWVQGQHIDIYFKDHQTALKFGCQRRDVYLINE